MFGWFRCGWSLATTIRKTSVWAAPPLLGPFAWVLESHRKQFIAEMRRRYGSDDRVNEIRIGSRKFVPLQFKRRPSLEQELRKFEKFLAKPEVWLCGE